MSLTVRENEPSDIGSGFLRLPTEVREIIYYYHLTSKRILPRYPSFTKRWTPIDLLYVNRTIYNEAFFHLYTKGEFVLAVRPESIYGLATCYSTSDPNANLSLAIFMRSEEMLGLIRHVSLNIHWPSREYSALMDHGSHWKTPSTGEMLQETIATVGAMLSRLPQLRTIGISWHPMTVRASDGEESAPPKFTIPGWLRGLEQIRWGNENVRIRMPLEGPVSTEELARNQMGRDDVEDTNRELWEDLELMFWCLGDWP